MDGVGKDIQIAIHDAETLKFKKSFKFNPDSGQEEVSGICVDRDKCILRRYLPVSKSYSYKYLPLFSPTQELTHTFSMLFN